VEISVHAQRVSQYLFECPHGESVAGGNMIVKMRGSNKGVHVESSGGDISVVLPPSVAGNIDAEAVAGVVKCSLPGHLVGEIGENELDAKINGGGSPIYAHTVGGDVRLLVSD
jgi:DUF4097 and DUF4098 domain-containing protein YvlB